MNHHALPHVVIVGGGFAGLKAAQKLKRAPVRVTLIDKRNFHLFQPLLYQVATGGLSPADIASPLRSVLKKHRNATVLMEQVRDIDPHQQQVHLENQTLNYDYLIVATGVRHHYFGHEEWEKRAPGLKTIEDAREMRQRILHAFELAEREPDPAKRRILLRFVIVGAGPTGVELAGALGELSRSTMKHNFRRIDPAEAEIFLVEGGARVLSGFPPELSQKAARALEKLGVRVHTHTMVTHVGKKEICFQKDGDEERVEAGTVLWAAGVKVSGLGARLAARCAADQDGAGRIKVQPDLTLPGFENLFVAGDLAHLSDASGRPIPGVAPAALQQGAYAARAIRKRLHGAAPQPFRYRNKGNLAVIGRNAAVADFSFFKFSGFPAWLLWAMVHIHFLIEFGNKLMVSLQWAWNYLTRKRGARLISLKEPSTPAELAEEKSESHAVV